MDIELFLNDIYFIFAVGLSLGITYGVLALLVPSMLNIFKTSTK